MSHNDYIKKLPDGFRSAAHSEKCPFGAIENPERKFYGTQFHPEVNHTEQGFDMLGNFLFNVCGCKGDWTMQSYAETATRELREKIGDGKALLALSGGVDSSVACKLLANAIGGRLTCIFVDHGLMRKNEGDEVEVVRFDYSRVAETAFYYVWIDSALHEEVDLAYLFKNFAGRGRDFPYGNRRG